VKMRWLPKCNWKPDTPASVPMGARISAGKSGKVERSLPVKAVSSVKRPPVSCIPSPESPANLMMTDCFSCACLTIKTCVVEWLQKLKLPNWQLGRKFRQGQRKYCVILCTARNKKTCLGIPDRFRNLKICYQKNVFGPTASQGPCNL
jgi:hypothetical protein